MGKHTSGGGRKSRLGRVASSSLSPTLSFDNDSAALAFMNENYPSRLPYKASESIYLYTSNQNGMYAAINGALRNGKVGDLPRQRKEVLDGLDAAFRLDSSVISHSLSAYRGFGAYSQKMATMQAGDTFTDNGFVSASVLPSLTWGDSRLVEIRVKPGTRAVWAAPHAIQPNEGELILNRGSRFRVVSPATNTAPMVIEVL